MNGVRFRRPSPALLVAAAALVAALAGTAAAGPVAKKAVTSKKVKKIADKEIKKKAPNLSVKNSDQLGGVAANGYTVSTATAASTSLPGFQSSSKTAVDIPGATASINVPDGQNATLVATFSGSSLCTNATAGFDCPIQVTVDGSTADPTPDPKGYLWDTTLPPASAPDKALSETVSKPVGPGSHTVKVTFGGAGVAGTTFTLRTWHLLVHTFPS
jgi:hypothetical protein